MENQGPRKIRLRRLEPRSLLNNNLPQDDVIQKNLEPLKQNIQKKMRAQEAYYQNSNNVGASPLVRDLNKQPVQQRLGRKLPFMGTSTSMLPPKMRLYKNSTLNNSIIKKKPTKRNYAQMRLNKIRERQRYQSLLMENNPNATRKIKLHRLAASSSIPNFKVQVRNSGNFTSTLMNGIKRHKIVLDSEIQIAISQLETMYTGENYVVLKITPKSTNVSMNDRFSNLS